MPNWMLDLKELEPYVWLAASLVVTLVVALVSSAWRKWISKSPYSLFRFSWRIFVYSVPFPRTDWSGSVTYIELGTFCVYLGINYLCLHYKAVDMRHVANRCGSMSAINMVPLFILGRSNPVSRACRLPLHVHHLVHHWVGRVAVIEGGLHILLIYLSDSFQPFLFPSGLVTSILLGCILLSSISPLRRCFYEVFLNLHVTLSVAIASTLIWHLSSRSWHQILFPSFALALWLFGFCFSIRDLRVRATKSTVTSFPRIRKVSGREVSDVDVLQVNLELLEPIIIKPGQYIYLRIHGRSLYEKAQAHPFMISWWDDSYFPVQKHWWRRSSPALYPITNKVTLIVQKVNGYTRRITDTSLLEKVSFAGPYGQQLGLQQYNNVFLMARGIGLAGVLSHAKLLLQWRKEPLHKIRVVTRKLDIYWELDDASQEAWGGPLLKELQEMTENNILQIICYFDCLREDLPAQSILNLDGTAFRYNGKENSIFTDVKQAASYSTGPSIIVTCGVASFTHDVRKLARKVTSVNNNVSFAETEYRPSSIKKVPDEDFELEEELHSWKANQRARKDRSARNKTISTPMTDF